MIEKLSQIKEMLKNTYLCEAAEEDKIKAPQDKKEMPAEDNHEVDLEKELKETDNHKEDYTKDIIAVINGMIEGTNTIEDLEKVIKSRKHEK